MFSAIFFDFDGVLVDSFAFHLKHLNEDARLPVSAERLRDLHAVNFHEATQHDATFDGVDWVKYHQLIAPAEAKQPMHPLAQATIRELYERKERLYIVSSGVTAGIKHFLAEHSLSECFLDVFGYEQGLSKTEKLLNVANRSGINLQESLFVTDTAGDVCEGKAAGVPVLAVTFGFHDREMIKAASPEYLCDRWEEARHILDL